MSEKGLSVWIAGAANCAAGVLADVRLGKVVFFYSNSDETAILHG
jgi:hypothetical protein